MARGTPVTAVRFPDELRDRLPAEVTNRGFASVSALVVAAVEEYLAAPVRRPRAGARPAGVPTAAGTSDCRHPKERLTVYGWGTICACGVRVR